MKRSVLFLCVHNSCRSQMAEGFLRHLGGDRFEIFSAGIEPTTTDERAIKAMREIGIDISTQKSKSVQEFHSRSFDYVITVCDVAQEGCPIFLGDAMKIHWDIPDPVRPRGAMNDIMSRFREVRDETRRKIEEFLRKSQKEEIYSRVHMQIEFLGTGGAVTIPKPFCHCRVCIQARERGVPYSRTGPSLFIHGPDVLIDTPEEIKFQLNRSRIKQINACFYSHWHPDHIMGRRVWEMNWDWGHWPPQNRKTDIYVPQQVVNDFKKMLGTWDHLAYFEKAGLIHLLEMRDGELLEINDVVIRPFRLAEDYVYAFLFEGGGRRLLVALDELFRWNPPEELKGMDVAVVPMGPAEFNPLTGTRQYPEGHPVLKSEATYVQTLDIIRSLCASRVFITHIEEPDGLGYDDLKEVEGRLAGEGLSITFAYDTLIVDI